MVGIEEQSEAAGSKKIELMDFPDKVLLNIMVQMNNTALLNMTRVCKKSETIAQQAFAKKYDNYFLLELFYESLITERRQYQSFFCAFGENMIAISIQFDYRGPIPRNHWIFALLKRYCSKLSKIEFGPGEEIDLLKLFQSLPKPTLTHFGIGYTTIANTNWSGYRHPNLVCFNVEDLYDYQPQHIVNFISTNTQLEEIQLINLENEHYISFLEAIDGSSKNILKLEIMPNGESITWNIETLRILCNLTTLSKLHIDAKDFNFNYWFDDCQIYEHSILIVQLSVRRFMTILRGPFSFANIYPHSGLKLRMKAFQRLASSYSLKSLTKYWTITERLNWEKDLIQ